MNLKGIKLIILLASAIPNIAIIISNRRPTAGCPGVAYVKDFAIDRINGTWYRTYSTQFNATYSNKCDHIKFSITLPGFLSIYRKYINEFDLEVKVLGVATHVEIGLLFHYPAYAETKMFEVLKTDYENYLMLYYCNKSGFNVWIHTRKPQLDQKSAAEIVKYFQDNNYESFKIYQIQQQNCKFVGY